MLRNYVGAPLLAVLATVASSALAQPAQYSSKDIVNTFAKSPATADQLQESRGFSLPTRVNHAERSTPMHGGAETVARAPASWIVATSAPHRDLQITFKSGSAELTGQAKANARVFAEAISSPALADAKFDLDGYTDAQGDKTKNQILSEARAASLKDFLVARGVSDRRLSTQGYGASDFAVPSDPMSAKNRRVVARRTD